MDYISGMIGLKKNENQSTTGQSTEKIGETEETLLKKQEFFKKKIEIELGIAKKNKISNKSDAISALKRKKLFEKKLEQISMELSSIGTQGNESNEANAQLKSFDPVGKALKVLSDTYKRLDVRKTEDLLENISEEEEILGKLGDYPEEFDEAELENELKDLPEFEAEIPGVDNN